MKKILLLFLLLLSIISCGKKEVLFSELQHRKDGLYYEKNQNKPFSGIVLTKYEDGQIEEKAKMVKGVLHGEFSLYTENGDLRIKGKYINGFLDDESNYLIALEKFQDSKEGDKDIKKINNLLFNNYPDKYDNVWQPKEGLARAKKDGKYGYIDDNGKVIIPFEYEYAEDFNEGLAIVWKGYKLLVDDYFKCGYIDKTGKEVISIKYDNAEKFKNGIAKVTENRESFFINKMGEKIISFKYDKLSPFKEGLAAAEKDGKWGYIDKAGKVIIPFQYDYASEFNGDLAIVAIGEEYHFRKYFYINKAGNDVTEINRYEYLGPFRDNLALVQSKENWKYGYIDKTGKEVISTKYDNASHFGEGLAAVKKNGKWGYIDKTGKEVISTSVKYDYAHNFSEGLAAIEKNGKWGYIDKTGKVIIPFQYNVVFFSFQEGMQVVVKNWKYGYIDKTGKEVISTKYDDVSCFGEGLAAVKKDEKWGYIDKNEKIIIPFQYDYASEFSEGLAAVEKNGKWIYIDKTGTIK